MARNLPASVVDAVREGVPFLAVTLLWVLVMLLLYGLFLLTKPSDISYDAWVHGSVFVPPLIGFLGHTLYQALTALNGE